MGEHQDFCMHPPGDPQPVAGICHARGHNAELPPVWMVYITVDDLDESVRRCEALGGKRRSEIHVSPMGRYCAIEDPAGAVSALFESAK
jgi:predicted enzyme related to lactoylglutathione lyase